MKAKYCFTRRARVVCRQGKPNQRARRVARWQGGDTKQEELSFAEKTNRFVGRWTEDVIQGDQTIRVERSMVLGTVAELKTKRNARRLLDPILARINSFYYRPSQFISVEKFADTWEAQGLTHQKPSSVKAVESHLRTYIGKHLGKVLLHELTPQIQQNFVTLVSQRVSRKTVLNVLPDC